MVGLRGFNLNPALLTYLTDGSPTRPARNPGHRREHRVGRRLPAEVIERLVVEYRTGATAAELARCYGLGKSTVLRLIRKAGVQVRHPRLSARETANLVALFEAGLPQKDIAKRLGRSPSAVWHCLHRLGLVGEIR